MFVNLFCLSISYDTGAQIKLLLLLLLLRNCLCWEVKHGNFGIKQADKVQSSRARDYEVEVLSRAVFQMTIEKPKPKQLLRPITTRADSAMNQSQFLAITCNSLEAREKSRVHGAIGFGFDSHWLKNWRESFKPITKRSNRNQIITFSSHLKTAL